ncbi:MAG: DUF429 domain-containing protein [Oscillospiraceae bacterium]|nr:DUF429 domain-containing protein [Oscillospiraceae bacterium]
MKRYNCTVLFNEDKSKILFCKRTKDPYKGLYNFVGGKAEFWERGISAAYRELKEETGISSSQVRLYRLMDITYYRKNFILELYVGKLSGQAELTEEVNPLLWLPVTEDFTDMHRFAGDQNIAHIVNTALQYPLDKMYGKYSPDRQQDIYSPDEQYDKSDKGRNICIGADGCKGGWIAAIIDNGKLKTERFSSVGEIVSGYPEFDGFLIDMPIGLPSNINHVRPDSLARKATAPRTSTIFPTPCRASVYSDTESGQIENNKICLGKGLSKQAMAIIPKIREIDTFLCEHEEYKNRIAESHPEVCFARLNGAVVMSKKSDNEGIAERVNILKRYVPELSETDIKQKSKELRCNADDIADAICLAITARLYASGKTESIPENPDTDDCGLKMQMIIPKG